MKGWGNLTVKFKMEDGKDHVQTRGSVLQQFIFVTPRLPIHSKCFYSSYNTHSFILQIQGGSNMTGTNWLVYAQSVPVIFEPPCNWNDIMGVFRPVGLFCDCFNYRGCRNVFWISTCLFIHLTGVITRRFWNTALCSVLLTRYHSGDQMKKTGMDKTCSTYVGKVHTEFWWGNLRQRDH